ncbi:hypothetical protein [Streptosporangium sp. NPDC049644]|uniref:hypothetical protein n=1 Tax=Streptosporangium sp. NPDC049644 TaxID=3155507 RepID=UPI003417FAAA
MRSTTTQAGHRPDGDPCWVELPSEAGAPLLLCYTTLLGWRFDENAHVGGYRRSWVGERKVAGIGGPALPRPSAGWRGYVSTSDLAESLRRTAAAGGRLVTGPVDVSPDGLFALVEDPVGVAVGLFQPGTDRGTQEASDQVGCVAGWVLESPDPEASVAFHRTLFGSWPSGVRAVPSLTGDGTWRACFAVGENSSSWHSGRAWPVSQPSADIREVTDIEGNQVLIRRIASPDQPV